MSKLWPSAAPPVRQPRMLPRLLWPAPALLAWAAGWLGSVLLVGAGMAPGTALAGAWALSLPLVWTCQGRWRRAIVAAGLPLSALALGLGATLPGWTWLLPLVVLLAAYPLRAWRDAPFFPTPRTALQGLEAVTGAPRRVLDAGCGLGHGLAELHRLWPQAELQGVEWSPPLALLCAWRARWAGWPARVQRGDMWAQPWRGHDLVYLFQRPESMARAWLKARSELAPGAWLVSLEFAVPDVEAWACLRQAGRRPVWIYRLSPAIQGSITGLAGR